MPLVPVNGIRLSVEVSGQGPPLVALHGFTGSAATWIPLADAVGSERTVVRVDLLGHGNSTAPDDPTRYAMDKTVADLLALADALGLDRPSWLGYSMGGRIALSVAVAAPDRCAALILEGASPGLEEASDRQERMSGDVALAERIDREGIVPFVDYWESLPLFHTQHRLPPEVRRRLRAQRLGNQPRGLANSLRGVGTGAQPSLWKHLDCLSMPICLIVGEEDSRFRQVAEQMHGALVHARIAIIAAAGHATHLEQPQRFQEEVRRFLRTAETLRSRRHLMTNLPTDVHAVSNDFLPA